MASHLVGSRISYPESDNKSADACWSQHFCLFLTEENKVCIPERWDAPRVTRGSRTAAAWCCSPPTNTMHAVRETQIECLWAKVHEGIWTEFWVEPVGCSKKRNEWSIINSFFVPRSDLDKKPKASRGISRSAGSLISKAWNPNPPQMAPDGQIKQLPATADSSYLQMHCCWWVAHTFLTRLVRGL